MTLARRKFLHLAAGAAALPALGNVARAQTYPSRPVRVIIPYPTGGAADVIPRLVGEQLKASFGQPAVIENVPGAGGSLGVGAVARAAPDGYTVVVGTTGTHVTNSPLYPLKYDVVKDFEPIALLATSPLLIVSRNSLPAKDLKELIAWLKLNNDKVSQAYVGSGAPQHLCGIDMQNTIGTRWQFVPYRGASVAAQELIGGQIDLMCAVPGSTLGTVRSGQIRAYAVTADERLSSAPEIPTVDEAGLPHMYNSVWYALFAPKGTPKDAIMKLNSAVVEAVNPPAVRERLAEIGLVVPPRERQTPEALAAIQSADIAKWWPIIEAANIKAE